MELGYTEGGFEISFDSEGQVGDLSELLSVAISEKESFRFFIFENCKKYQEVCYV